MVHRAAERVEVAAAVELDDPGLLRRQVFDRPDGQPGGGQRGRPVVVLQEGAEAEVEDLDLPGGSQHEVRRLDVAVDDA